MRGNEIVGSGSAAKAYVMFQMFQIPMRGNENENRTKRKEAIKFQIPMRGNERRTEERLAEA